MSNTERNEIQFQIKQLNWALAGEWPNNEECNMRRRKYLIRLETLKGLLA
jgi:hypothetical protein